ncbi:MAG: hypothetical protein ACYC18_10055 [Gammaproteobacteria bacterium]
MDSGGSNRIRSALLQVIVYLLDFGLSPGGTIRRPRLHGWGHHTACGRRPHRPGPVELTARFPGCHVSPVRSLYLGDVLGAMSDPGRGTCTGAGDPHRGRATVTVKPLATRPRA